MKIKTYIALSITLTGLLVSSCASDIEDSGLIGEGTEALTLSAMSISPDAVKGTNLFLTAKLSEAPSPTYIGETQIEIPALSASPSLIRFPSVKPKYPLGDKVINIYAYTGKAANGKMTLKAGKGDEFDAILSNNGQRGSAPIDPANEGKGTSGSTSDPASLLQFRHVMTQIVVDVKIDMSENPSVNPAPTSIQIGMDGLKAQGSYDITAQAPVAGRETTADKATGTSGKYTLKMGTNYVVPNGENLNGKGFTSLVIDDYTATTADLQGLIIQHLAGGTGDFYLLPGYSYNLTLTVSRLKVTAVELKLIPWKVQEINDNNVTYDSYKLGLDLGNYKNVGDDQITKVVLYTDDNKTYVGGTTVSSSNIQFITVPDKGAVNKVDLFTKKGLLLSSAISSEYDDDGFDKKLTMKISDAGMITENPGQPVSATNPYMVTTALQFLNIEKDLSSNFKQAAPIDMNSLRIEKFEGFGEFKGVFDGNGFWFSNMNVTGSGIFDTNSGTLQNMRIYTGLINAKGASFAGAFAGTNNGTIVACFNEAPIENSAGTVGGIVGRNGATGAVIACLNTGVIPQGNVVGGLVGTNLNTNAGALSACVNTGTLNHKAGKLGGISGTSNSSANSILNTCFWLIGSAERFIGSKETAVDSENIIRTNTSSRDTNELRNGISEGDGEEERIVNRLNAEIANFTDWKNIYEYVLDPLTTGSTWPVPRKK